jgi:poly-beta-1,6-N-acetyl-D-glucosamine synthase
LKLESRHVHRIPMPPNQEKTIYISVHQKFWLSHGFAFLWSLLAIYLSIPWVNDLNNIMTTPGAILIIGGISYVPGYLNAFLVISLLFDRQPEFKNEWPETPVSILIACRNEAENIADTLKYIHQQDYTVPIKVVVVDNGSTDDTVKAVLKAEEELMLDIQVIHEGNPGKFNALNTGIKHVGTELVITLDADTLLHRSAVRYLVARMLSAPEQVCAVAGSVLVRNSRHNLLTRIQEWDYFLGIASIKRLQGLYQGTLVAQGAYSIYKVKAVKEVGRMLLERTLF